MRSNRRVLHVHMQNIFPSLVLYVNIKFKAPDAVQRYDRKELFRVSFEIVKYFSKKQIIYIEFQVINCVNSCEFLD